MSALLVLSLLLATPPISPAPSPAVPAAKATLTDVAWIAGRWRSEDAGKVSEETWSAPQGESMVGSFRMVGADGAVIFYEILILRQTASGVEMRLRHFDAALVAAEEKGAPMVFSLGDHGTGHAVFTRTDGKKTAKPERLTYRREGDTLAIKVERPGRDPVEFELSLTR